MEMWKTKLQALMDLPVWEERKNYIFGYTEYAYEALKVIRNKQKNIDGIFTNELDCVYQKKLAGVELFQYTDLYEVNILTSFREYCAFKQFFFNEGYRINKNLFVDFGIQTGFSLCKLLGAQELCRVRRFFENCKQNINRRKVVIHDYLYEVHDISLGKRVFKKIEKQRRGDIGVFVYDYSGLGDVFVICGLLKNLVNNISESVIDVTVIGNGTQKVAGMFPWVNAIKLSDAESRVLTKYVRMFGEKANYRLITPFPRTDFTDIVSPSLAGKKVNMLDMYKYLYFKLGEDATFFYPQLSKYEEKAMEIIRQYGISKRKSVILSPYANTVIGFPNAFWKELVGKLKQEGYKVFTNCVGDEPPIFGTERIMFPLECAEYIVSYAGFLVALRSGFCDIVCNSTAKKVIIYPVYKLFNSSLYDFCSFQSMGIGRSYTEIVWKYEKYDELCHMTIESFQD